jgi:hypothetical protein
MPGLGQVIQRRWVSAAVHALFFNGFALVLVVRVVRALIANFKAAMEFADGASMSPFGTLSFRDILIPFALTMLFYVSGLVDTVRAARRAARASRPMPPRPPSLP